MRAYYINTKARKSGSQEVVKKYFHKYLKNLQNEKTTKAERHEGSKQRPTAEEVKALAETHRPPPPPP